MSSGSQKVFASVKSFSQRGRLLTKADLQTLAESRDLDELITRIKNTKYVDAVSKITKPLNAAKIESALRGELAEIHYSIAKTAGKLDILDAYYMKFLISNLKLILKGKALGKSQEEIEPHLNLHAEELINQRDIIVKALTARDLEEAVASLSSVEFGDEMAKAVSLYNDKKNVQIFDVFLDKMLYQHLGRAMRSIVTQTPSVPRELLGKLISSDSVRGVFDELSTSRYRDLIPQVEDDMEAVSAFEHAFEMAIYKTVNRSFTKMFSFATVVGITKLTTYEVRNIAAIAFAVEQKISPQTTMARLIVSQED
ncbi:MAG: ATPase [Nitrosopumilaceae archaeon]|nr:ATPase [Nitrosopumilaceae archaeon]